METVTELIEVMFKGAITGAQGLGRTISAGFQSIFHDAVVNAETGAITYSETYSEIAEFFMTFAGLGLSFMAVLMFVRWLWARKRG